MASRNFDGFQRVVRQMHVLSGHRAQPAFRDLVQVVPGRPVVQRLWEFDVDLVEIDDRKRVPVERADLIVADLEPRFAGVGGHVEQRGDGLAEGLGDGLEREEPPIVWCKPQRWGAVPQDAGHRLAEATLTAVEVLPLGPRGASGLHSLGSGERGRAKELKAGSCRYVVR